MRALSAGLNIFVDRIYAWHRSAWQRLQRSASLADDRLADMGGAAIAIIGMGRVGTGAYDELVQLRGRTVVGVDIDAATVRHHLSKRRNVLLGDPIDGDFWDRVHAADNLELVMVALPKLASGLAVLNQLKDASSDVPVAATAQFEDEVESLKRAGASDVFNIYAEVGSGFAIHATAHPPIRRQANGSSRACALARIVAGLELALFPWHRRIHDGARQDGHRLEQEAEPERAYAAPKFRG